MQALLSQHAEKEKMNESEVVIHGVGDMRPKRDDPESLYAVAAPKLKEADILFGHLETNFSERGAPQMHAFSYATRAHPDNVRALASAGFHVVSYASNHHLDWGEVAMFDTLDALKRNNIAVTGVGRNIEEARKPAIIERKGTRVAFLNYCSVLPTGYEADKNKSGGAPIRVSTFYEQVDWQPATPPKIISFARKDEIAAMEEDIRKAKRQADVVVMSIHWGIHFVPALIAMYQKEVAYKAIDAGVDVIFGHHPHILKGIEVYKGKVIFYSMGNFGFDQPLARLPGDPSKFQLDYYWGRADAEYPTYKFPADSRKTMVAKCVVSEKRISRVSFFPATINTKGQPEICVAGDKRGDGVFDYMNQITKDQKLDSRLVRQGDEIVVRTCSEALRHL